MPHIRKDWIIQEMQLHPYLQPEDLIKFSFQAAFGAEHLLTDVDSAREYLRSEWEKTEDRGHLLLQELSSDFGRLDLSAAKVCGLREDEVFDLFLESTRIQLPNSRLLFEECIEMMPRLIADSQLLFNEFEWYDVLFDYQKTGIHPLHHSRIYHHTAKPKYRVVYLPYFAKIIRHNEV